MKTVDKHIPGILIALIIAIAPYVVWLPIWVIVWCLLLWGYAFQIARGKWPRPKAWIQHSLSLVGLIGVLISFDWRLSGETFVGMLAIMVSLKPMEIQSHRDKMVTVFLAFFLVLTNLFYHDSLLLGHLLLEGHLLLDIHNPCDNKHVYL